MKKLSELCNEDFFNALGVALGESDCAQFIIDSKVGLHIHILLNYDMPIHSELKDQTPAYLATNYFAPLYGQTLIKLFNALTIEYNPLHNTDVTTTENANSSFEHTSEYDSDKKKTGSDREILGGKDSYSNTVTENNTHNYSTTYDDISLDVTDKTGKPTTQATHAYSDEGETSYGKNTTLSYGSTESHEGSDTNSGSDESHRGIHRVGNIGITPNQRLIEIELNLRLRNQFFSQITAFLVEAFASGLWGDDDDTDSL